MAVAAATDEQRLGPAEVSQLQVTWHRFLQNRPGVIALTVLIILSAAVIIIPFFSPFGAETTTVDQLNQPAGTIDSLNGRVHILGTDSIGHDSFTRYLVGTRTSLFVSIISAVAIVILGSLIGAIAGFYGGAVDTLLMRLTDFMLSLPLIPVYLLSIKLIRTSAQDYVGTVATIALLFVLFNWMGVSRLVRGSILSLRTYSFVEASRALGANNRRLIFNHLLPNSFAPVLVAATFAAGDFIIWEAILSYFGQGITDPPAPSLGNLLTDAQDSIWYFMDLNPFHEIRAYQILIPTFLIMTTVLCINYIGDALRDALDPHRIR